MLTQGTAGGRRPRRHGSALWPQTWESPVVDADGVPGIPDPDSVLTFGDTMPRGATGGVGATNTIRAPLLLRVRSRPSPCTCVRAWACIRQHADTAGACYGGQGAGES